MFINLANLKLLGFDNSRHIPFTRRFRVACSQCQAMNINGIPTHEKGCPHEMHECRDCNEIIPARQKYCECCA